VHFTRTAFYTALLCLSPTALHPTWWPDLLINVLLALVVVEVRTDRAMRSRLVLRLLLRAQALGTLIVADREFEDHLIPSLKNAYGEGMLTMAILSKYLFKSRSPLRRGYHSLYSSFGKVFYVEKRWKLIREMGWGAYGFVMSALFFLAASSITKAPAMQFCRR
jgi:hypothetical protein